MYYLNHFKCTFTFLCYHRHPIIELYSFCKTETLVSLFSFLIIIFTGACKTIRLDPYPSMLSEDCTVLGNCKYRCPSTCLLRALCRPAPSGRSSAQEMGGPPRATQPCAGAQAHRLRRSLDPSAPLVCEPDHSFSFRSINSLYCKIQIIQQQPHGCCKKQMRKSMERTGRPVLGTE